MLFPENLKYTKDHEWVRLEGDIAWVGITDFAQNELGDIVYIEVGAIGETLKIEDTLGTIEAVKTVSDLFMPLSGKVIELNADIESNPDIVNKDPYGNGWIVKIKLTDLSELDQLLNVEKYKALIGVS